jgi:hypothetical protein
MAETRAGSVGSRLFSAVLIFLFCSAVYLFAFPQPNVFYAGMVLAHALIGVLATILLVPALWRAYKRRSLGTCLAWALLFLGALVGVWLIYTGTPRSHWNSLYAHIIVSMAGAGIAFANWWGRRAKSTATAAALARALACLLVLAALGAGGWYIRQSRWHKGLRIENARSQYGR